MKVVVDIYRGLFRIHKCDWFNRRGLLADTELALALHALLKEAGNLLDLRNTMFHKAVSDENRPYSRTINKWSFCSQGSTSHRTSTSPYLILGFCSIKQLKEYYYSSRRYNAMQYNAIQCNAIQCNTMQYNTMQYNTMQCNTIQCNKTQCNAIQYNTMQCNTMQCNTMQCNAIQCNAMQCNTIQ